MNKIITALLITGLLCACSKKELKSGEETIRVKTEKASLQEGKLMTPYVGVVEAEKSTLVSFTGMALLKQMNVSEGETVKKGQLLARIDDSQAQHAVQAAKAALDQALDAQERLKMLHENNSLPEMKWVEIVSKVQQAQAAYDISRKNLDDCTIYAPANGVIGSRIMDVGETVLPTEPVLDILSIDNVKVRVSIPETEIAKISPETTSTVTLDALPGETFCGGKIEKSVSADATTHTYDIRICLENSGHRLLPGMVAKVVIQSDDEPQIALPIRAVQQAAVHNLFVWVVRNGKAERQTVTVGDAIGNRITIKSGLKVNDTVIVDGYQKVGQGTPVSF